MKTVILLIPESFPKKHANAGQRTYFVKKIQDGTKIHEIRSNFNYWLEKAELVNSGDAELYLHELTDFRYDLVHDSFAKYSQMVIQRLKFIDGDINQPTVHGRDVEWSTLSNNNGLTVDQLKDYFKYHDLNETFAVIFFNNDPQKLY